MIANISSSDGVGLGPAVAAAAERLELNAREDVQHGALVLGRAQQDALHRRRR